MVIKKDIFEALKTNPPVFGATTYVDFKRSLAESNCTGCELASGRTKIVVDRGNFNARAMAIGEGPGADEDREGRAFVGRSGRKLDSMMEEAGLDSEKDFLIANIVKCRPENNRAPKKEEAHACMPYLMRQIQLVQPRIVALLGRTPATFLLPEEFSKTKMSDLVGRFLGHPSLEGVEILALYHPAYILRNPSKREIMVEHLVMLRERLHERVRLEG